MSYILEALKRADAQRTRGTVPGLGAQSLGAGTAYARSTRTVNFAVWPWLGLGLLVLALVLGLWWWQQNAQHSSQVPSSVTSTASTAPNLPPAATPSLPAAPAPLATAPSTAAATPIAKPKPQQTTPTAPAQARVASAVLGAEPQAATSGLPSLPPPLASPSPPSPTPTLKPPLPTPTQAAPTALAGLGASASQADARVLSPSELSQTQRVALAKLVVNGVVYSDNPAQRVLVLGGQPFGEGDSVSPGLSVERIGAKNSVLNVQGQRVRIDH